MSILPSSEWSVSRQLQTLVAIFTGVALIVAYVTTLRSELNFEKQQRLDDNLELEKLKSEVEELKSNRKSANVKIEFVLRELQDVKDRVK